MARPNTMQMTATPDLQCKVHIYLTGFKHLYDIVLAIYVHSQYIRIRYPYMYRGITGIIFFQLGTYLKPHTGEEMYERKFSYI